MFKAKIIYFSDRTEFEKTMFHKSVLSPFLFNVFMTPLDYFVKELKSNCEKVSSSYLRNFDQNPLKTAVNPQSYKLLKKNKIEVDHSTKFQITNEAKNVYYVRYLDNLLLGLNMDKKLARIITTKIRDFIKSDLHINCHGSDFNTKLIHGRSELITFLGFQIGFYPSKYNTKSTYLIRFNKLKANIQRKRIIESEAYLKMVEKVCARWHRQVINSIRTHGQTLIKQSQIKKVTDHKIKVKAVNILKKSLSQVESEIMMLDIKPHLLKSDRSSMSYPSSLFMAEQKRLDFLNDVTQKWIRKAVDIANKEDDIEIKNLVGKYLSPRFIQIREAYLKELEKISSMNFSEKIVDNKLTKIQNSTFENMLIKIRILFPVKDIKKRLRLSGLIHRVITRPIGINYLTSRKDYAIINWYSLKANGLWNYYCCVDNTSELKKVLNWVLRYSLLGTLASKYKSSIKQMIHRYTLAPKINYIYQKKDNEFVNTIAYYPSKEYFNKKKKILIIIH